MIGNPPYVSAPAQVDNDALNWQREQVIQSKKYRSLYQKWDLYIPFIELGLQRLSGKGVFSMIVPYPLTNQTYALKMREMLLSEFNLYELTDLNGVKVFDNATVSNCIPFVKKESSVDKKVKITKIDGDKILFSHYRNYCDMVQSKKHIWNLSDGHIESNYNGFILLGDICYISKGMVLNADEQTARGEFKKDDLISLERDSVHSRRYVEAKDIEPYRVKKYRWLEWNTKRCPDGLSRPTFRELYECEKLMVNRLGRMQVYLDQDERLLHSDSIYAVVLWHRLSGVANKSITASIKRYCRLSREEMEAISKRVNPKYLLAILNSSMGNILLEEQRGGDYHIYPEHLRQIPIPIPSEDIQNQLSEMIDELLISFDVGETDKQNALQAEIDNKVKALYQHEQ